MKAQIKIVVYLRPHHPIKQSNILSNNGDYLMVDLQPLRRRQSEFGMTNVSRLVNSW